jgi:hypothetical protein
VVIHLFIDSHSCYITGIGVHDNNREDSVLNLFIKAIAETGIPVESVVIMGGEILPLHATWKNIVVVVAIHISGAGRIHCHEQVMY